MRYYVTKYALSNMGVPIVVESDAQAEDGFVRVKLPGQTYPTSLKLGRDIFSDEANAKSSIYKARDKKCASLNAQIKKLRAII